MTNLTPKRRRIAMLGGAIGALLPGLALASHNHDSVARAYSLVGLVIGVVVALPIIVVRRRRGLC